MKSKLLWLFGGLLITFITSCATNSFNITPTDKNRSIIFGYFEYEDLRYDIIDGDGRYLDIRPLGETLPGIQALRLWLPDEYEKAKKDGRIGFRFREVKNIAVEKGIPVEITTVLLSDNNKNLEPTIIKIGSGFLIYFTDIPTGDWQITTIFVGKIPRGYYRIETNSFYDTFLPIYANISDFSSDFSAEPIKISISSPGVYYLGSYHVSSARDWTVIKGSEINRIYKRKTLIDPTEKDLLKELLKLSKDTAWEQMINEKLIK